MKDMKLPMAAKMDQYQMGKYRKILSDREEGAEEEAKKYLEYFRGRKQMQKVLSMNNYEESGENLLIKNYGMYKLLNK